jgi:hypothetical protein
MYRTHSDRLKLESESGFTADCGTGRHAGGVFYTRYILGSSPLQHRGSIAQMPDTESGIIEPFPHNIGQASSSIALTHVEENPTEQSQTHSLTPKISQFQEELPQQRPGRRKQFALRAAAWLDEKYPRTTRNVTRALYYVRGPRPYVPTPGAHFNQ